MSQLVSFETLKLAAGAVLLSPFIPLLFMGEEYGETAPFPYFISHLDPDLVDAVRRGRRQEFAAFAWQGEPPDPQDETTFHRATLNHHLRQQKGHQTILSFYQELIRLRKDIPALVSLSKEDMEVWGLEKKKVLLIQRWWKGEAVVIVLNFGHERRSALLPLLAGRWLKQLDSADERWHGPGSMTPAELEADGEATLTLPPESFVLYAAWREH